MGVQLPEERSGRHEDEHRKRGQMAPTAELLYPHAQSRNLNPTFLQEKQHGERELSCHIGPLLLQP